jgi:hypothetical protein
MYVEIDGVGSCPGVLEICYDPVEKQVESVLPPERIEGLSILQVEVPQLLKPEQQLMLLEVERSFNSYQRRREQGSARMLGRLLERFGALPPEVVQQVQAASLFKLQARDVANRHCHHRVDDVPGGQAMSSSHASEPEERAGLQSDVTTYTGDMIPRHQVVWALFMRLSDATPDLSGFVLRQLEEYGFHRDSSGRRSSPRQLSPMTVNISKGRCGVCARSSGRMPTHSPSPLGSKSLTRLLTAGMRGV